MIDRYQCILCGYPEVLPSAPNSKLGKLVFWRGVSKESIEKHIKKHHPEYYEK